MHAVQFASTNYEPKKIFFSFSIPLPSVFTPIQQNCIYSKPLFYKPWITFSSPYIHLRIDCLLRFIHILPRLQCISAREDTPITPDLLPCTESENLMKCFRWWGRDYTRSGFPARFIKFGCNQLKTWSLLNSSTELAYTGMIKHRKKKACSIDFSSVPQQSFLTCICLSLTYASHVYFMYISGLFELRLSQL